MYGKWQNLGRGNPGGPESTGKKLGFGFDGPCKSAVIKCPLVQDKTCGADLKGLSSDMDCNHWFAGTGMSHYKS